VLIAVPAWLRLTGVAPAGGWPKNSFLPWAAIVTLVAVAEEALLRGVLFSAVRAAAADTRFATYLAVGVTSTSFALLHVPLYGWAVVPLDLAVGVWLGGLRVLSGGVTAPATAHALADLAGWWLT
jgi:membrane protease YdiL (CAAX protease family)